MHPLLKLAEMRLSQRQMVEGERSLVIFPIVALNVIVRAAFLLFSLCFTVFNSVRHAGCTTDLGLESCAT